MSSSSRTSLRDIAKRLDVSHTTVSRALKNDPRISAAMREKVELAAREMGYSPDPLMTALAHYRLGKRDRLLGTVIAWLNHWPRPEELHTYGEMDGYWRGAKESAEKFGYKLEEFVFGHRVPARRMEEIFRARGIPGVIIPPHPCYPIRPDWTGFDWKQFSIVRIGRSNRDPTVHLVASDHVANAAMAVAKIHELGYRRIGFVTGQGAAERGTQFLAGFLMGQAALKEGECLPYLLVDEETPDKGQAQLFAWIEEQRPDAIFTDIAAMIAMLKAGGLRVPEEIGVATTSILDGRADAGIFQNAEEIGRMSFLALLSRMLNHDVGLPEIPHQILVSGEWRDGKTLPARLA